jgi:hypothetical protein
MGSSNGIPKNLFRIFERRWIRRQKHFGSEPRYIQGENVSVLAVGKPD